VPYDAREHVIWSADVSEIELREYMNGGLPIKLIKIDRAGLTAMGMEIIDEVKDHGYEVFADAKIIEVPSKVMALAKQHLEYKPWMLNVMAGACSNGNYFLDTKEYDVLKQFADACLKVGTFPCAVSVLTSKTEELTKLEFGKTSVDQVTFYADQLVKAGFTHMVCSPLEIEAVRKEFGKKIKLVTPGVRLPGGNTHDQQRVDTPLAALQKGASYVVIGRELTRGDIQENFERIAAHLKN
jgi:orotidine-5'-phosphate decarboxylase